MVLGEGSREEQRVIVADSAESWEYESIGEEERAEEVKVVMEREWRMWLKERRGRNGWERVEEVKSRVVDKCTAFKFLQGAFDQYSHIIGK